MSSKTEDKTIFGNKKVTEDVKRKVLAEKRAYDTVKTLLEENITKLFFSNAIHLLTEAHYNDVIEERAILHLCGYAVCGNKLKNVPSQQYRISGNKVYDITQRKNFCSNACYRASECVRKQVLSTPLWLRDPENIVPIELDSSGFGLKGEEVDLLHFATTNDTESEEESSDECEIAVEEEKKNIFASATAPEDTHHTSELNSSHPLHEPSPTSKFDHKPPATVKESSVQTPPSSKEPQQLRIVDSLLSVLKEWITADSLALLGYKREHTAQDAKKQEESTSEEIRNMNKQKLLEAKINQVVLGKRTDGKDRSSEIEAAHIYTQRVEQYYKGQMTSGEVHFKEAKPAKRDEKTATPFYPHVDSKNQTVIRRKILHGKLAKVFQELIPQLPSGVSSHDLKQLISSFQLSSSNVILATNQYPLMAIMLMLLLSKRNLDVKSCLRQSEPLLRHVISVYHLGFESLNERIEALLNSLPTSR